MSLDKEQLELVATDDLVAEILGRFQHVVLCGMNIPIDGEQHVIRRWRGNSMTCSGLCQSASMDIINDWNADARRTNGEDDTDVELDDDEP